MIISLGDCRRAEIQKQQTPIGIIKCGGTRCPEEKKVTSTTNTQRSGQPLTSFHNNFSYFQFHVLVGPKPKIHILRKYQNAFWSCFFWSTSGFDQNMFSPDEKHHSPYISSFVMRFVHLLYYYYLNYSWTM